MAITDAWLKANHKKERHKITEKTDRDGLSARVTRKGKIVFQMRFRLNGKQNRVDIGSYPLITLKKAREQAHRFKYELEKGNDPRITKRIEKNRNMEAMDLQTIFLKWFDSYCQHNKKNADQIKRSFELHVFPELGMLPPDKITADQWLTLLEGVTKKAPGIAARILTNAKQMLSWARRRKLVADHVLSDINPKQDLNIVKKPGSRSLTDQEIKMMYVCLNESRIAAKNKLFIQLCLIYGCRNGELRQSKKEDFDFNSMVWIVPAENHKTGQVTGKPLKRPITGYIQELIKECFLLSPGNDYLFTNAGSQQPMTIGSPISLPYHIMQWLRKNEGYDMEHWSMHDLRKTARTNFSTLTEPHVAEIMLGHKLPGEWMTYDHHDYLEEQAECLEKWVKRLNMIIA